MSNWNYDGMPIDQCSVLDEGGLAFAIMCIDDTDDATKQTSTGFVAQRVAKEVVRLGGVVQLGITRHQLLLREDVPYTSHNSAMAFGCWIDASALGALYQAAIDVVQKHRALTSDPGICLIVPPANAKEHAELIAFGKRAKVDFCSKESAYSLASRYDWIRLEEHGGDGAGVVGALAGAGLRLEGEDGRFRGKWNLEKSVGEQHATAGGITECLSSALCGPVLVVDNQGKVLSGSTPVFLDTEAKPILLHGSLALVCAVKDGIAYPLEKVDLGAVGNVDGSWSCVCESFVWDNDEEECLDGVPSCKNCLHRRWVKRGFMCAVGASKKLG